MKNIILIPVFFFGLLFNQYLVVAQTCTTNLVPPFTLPNGITVTSTSTGSVGTWLFSHTSCGVTTPVNSVWLGNSGAFTYNLFFSIPINSIRLNITATGDNLNENFIFTTDAGNPTITSITSCFSVISGNTILSGANASGFGGGGEFLISTLSPFTQMAISGLGGEAGSCLSFCGNSVIPFLCPGNLTLVSATNDVSNLSLPIIGVRHNQAEFSISATNNVLFGDNSFQNGVIYHAGNSVELNPGFEAVFGSQFTAYIEGCTDNYTYKSYPIIVKQNVTSKTTPTALIIPDSISIFPNPSTNSISITMKNSRFKSISINTINGIKMFQSNYDNKNNCLIDISNFISGVYIIKILTCDGQIISKKLIKI